ncbi:MAG: hypothetical protein ACPGYX_12750 [Oceanobacter sp.]
MTDIQVLRKKILHAMALQKEIQHRLDAPEGNPITFSIHVVRFRPVQIDSIESLSLLTLISENEPNIISDFSANCQAGEINEIPQKLAETITTYMV